MKKYFVQLFTLSKLKHKLLYSQPLTKAIMLVIRNKLYLFTNSLLVLDVIARSGDVVVEDWIGFSLKKKKYWYKTYNLDLNTTKNSLLAYNKFRREKQVTFPNDTRIHFFRKSPVLIFGQRGK